MIKKLIRVYRVNPARPHCKPGRHAWPCRVAAVFLAAAVLDCSPGSHTPRPK